MDNMTATQVKAMHEQWLDAQGKAMQEAMDKTMTKLLFDGLHLLSPHPVTLVTGKGAGFNARFFRLYEGLAIKDGGVGPHFLTNWKQRFMTERFTTLSISIQQREKSNEKANTWAETTKHSRVTYEEALRDLRSADNKSRFDSILDSANSRKQDAQHRARLDAKPYRTGLSAATRAIAENSNAGVLPATAGCR